MLNKYDSNNKHNTVHDHKQTKMLMFYNETLLIHKRRQLYSVLSVHLSLSIYLLKINLISFDFLSISNPVVPAL